MKAVLWMLGTLLSFSLMAISARELSATIATEQTLFVRSVIGLICVSAVIYFSQETISLKSQRMKLHLVRNGFHFLGQYGWFLGIGLLPLAEVFALEFTVPIWTLIIASIALHEKITKRKVVAIIVGMVGVVVILQPAVTIIERASIIVLLSAMCYGVAHTSTKALSHSEPPIVILWYMCVMQLPLAFILSCNKLVMPNDIEWLWLLLVGIMALTAHYCMIKAMQYAEATTIVTLDFLRLPLIMLVGVVFYAESLDIAIIIGGLLMLMANIISLRKSSDDGC